MVSKNDNLCANALFAFLRATIAACLTLFLSSASVFAQVGGERAEYRLSADGKTFEQYHGPGGLFSVPEGVEKISGAAFMGYDALTSVEIPASVSSIGGGAFGACRALAAINVAEDNAYFRSIDGVLFTKDGKTLIKYPEGKDGENYSVPEGVQTLFDYAFGKCPSLKSVVLPESATTIGDRAFSECYALSSFAVPENVETIGGYAFAECSSLTSIVIPEKVSSIGRAAFSRCASLISIEVEEGNANYRSDDGVLYAKDGKTLIKYPPKREGERYAILGGA
ncbi:MAG: leucine-rich repeat domain-containing protein [Thermoguttaceae bacterium]|nr:leucine-rich repeat domain-containing protein [Thermoguttaceae bacterium]